jgi:MFS family permease
VGPATKSAREPRVPVPWRARVRSLTPDFALVRGNRSFRLLFVAAFGSGIGTWFATVALQIDVYSRTHQSATWVGVLLIANTSPMVLVGFLGGSLIDRLPRRRLMIGADLVRAAVFVILPFAGSALALVVLAFVAGAASAFFRPAVLAGLPNSVGEEDLPLANGLLQSADFLTTALAPVIGAALVAAASPSAAYVVNAVSFLFSAFLLFRIAPQLLHSEQSLSRGHFADIKEGLGVVVRSPALVTVLVTFSIAIVASSFVNVAEIALAKETLHAGSLGFGLLWTASGIGLVIGSVLGGRLLTRLGARLVYPTSLAIFGIGVAASGAAPSIWVAFATMILTGFGNGVFVVCNITLVQTGAPDRVRGRAFTTIMSANVTFSIVGMVVAGPLTNWGGARWVYEIAAVVMVAATVVAAVLTRRIVPVPDVVPPLLEDIEVEPGIPRVSV